MHFLDDGQQPQPDRCAARRPVGRITATEYNLAVRRAGTGQATSVPALLAGQFRTDREGQ